MFTTSELAGFSDEIDPAPNDVIWKYVGGSWLNGSSRFFYERFDSQEGFAVFTGFWPLLSAGEMVWRLDETWPTRSMHGF